MSKQVSFGGGDMELIKKIEKFQKAQGLPSFIAAVRVLCDSGLSISKIVKKVK